jgi:hypothetical protein
MKDFEINLYDVVPVAFHGYTSCVFSKILESRDDKETFNYYKGYLLEMFKEKGIKARDDNKIVFECTLHGKTIYYGFYDLTFSIGFGLRSDYINYTINKSN